MLRYTGHALYDVGVATVTAYAGKSDPAAVTEEDCIQVAHYIEDNYPVPPLSSFLTVSLMNSDFTQPAYRDDLERRKAYARLVAGSFRADVPTHPTEVCAFTGEPALALPLSLREEKPLPPGRAFRQHLPLVTGEGIINFSALGNPGVPISGKALLCFQWLPMGCFKCGGRLLAIHSDNPEILLFFANAALKENLQAVRLARDTGQTKLPEAPRAAQTLLVERLIEIESMRRDMQEEQLPYTVEAYHFTNGKSSPLDHRNLPLQIYRFPLQITDFLASVLAKEYKQLWNMLVRRAWEYPRNSSQMKSKTKNTFVPRRNYLYEALFRLPEGSVSFVRRHFLKAILSLYHDALQEQGTNKQPYLGELWPLVALFLRKVMHMDTSRIEAIRTLGQRLADYVYDQNDRRFFRVFFTARYWPDFSTLLLKTNLRHIEAAGNTKPPLIDFESFLVIFAIGEDLGRPDWYLARDLVYLRMVDILAEKKWLGKNQDLLSEITKEATEDTNFSMSNEGGEP